MIRLSKRPLPTTVASMLAVWEAKRAAAAAVGKPLSKYMASRYRHPLVKAILRAETNGKCAYCASHVTHVYPGDVEHIVAKDHEPEGTFKYENLTFSCFICNNAKHDYYDPTLPLVNPYKDDPDNHLVAAGPLVVHRPGSKRGKVTHARLALNRTPLVERRIERLQQMSLLVDQYLAETSPGLRGLLEHEITRLIDLSSEFSFVLAQYVRGTCGLNI